MNALEAKLGGRRDEFGRWRPLAFWSGRSPNPRPRRDLELAHRRRFGPDAKAVEFRVRRRNPASHQHVPPETVLIGQALDLVTQLGDVRTTWDFEVRDWRMLCDPDAMDRRPGQAGLYLVRGKLATKRLRAIPAGEDTYARWHEREFDSMKEIDAPDLLSVYVGRATVIGYRSDKWERRGNTHDYTHDFEERGHVAPEAWADNADLSKAKAVVLFGGTMRITEAGID